MGIFRVNRGQVEEREKFWEASCEERKSDLRLGKFRGMDWVKLHLNPNILLDQTDLNHPGGVTEQEVIYKMWIIRLDLN